MNEWDKSKNLRLILIFLLTVFGKTILKFDTWKKEDFQWLILEEVKNKIKKFNKCPFQRWLS